jgi:uncharacterized protein
MDEIQACFELLGKGDGEGLRRLLEEDAGVAEARDASGISLLMHSLYQGRRDMAELISAKKKELDIFEAASLGKLDRLAACALDAATVNARSKDGFTALHFACYFGQSKAARLLLKKGAAVDAVASNSMRVMALHSAASSRNLDAARLLLEHGASINARQQGGWTPIHAAAQNGDRAMVELMLSHGADPGLANDDGKTPARVAREKGHGEIAALLEKVAGSEANGKVLKARP